MIRVTIRYLAQRTLEFKPMNIELPRLILGVKLFSNNLSVSNKIVMNLAKTNLLMSKVSLVKRQEILCQNFRFQSRSEF